LRGVSIRIDSATPAYMHPLKREPKTAPAYGGVLGPLL
jgi:hypothetical protein